MRILALALVIVAATSCAFVDRLRPGPTIAPLISAAFLSVHLVAGDASDAQERQRLPGLRDALAGALPGSWSVATAGRGMLNMRTDGDIDVTLEGTNGTSALTQHTRGGKVTSRTIAVHTIDGSRRLTLSELVATTLHELGHIWCCTGPDASPDGHWAQPSADPLLQGVDRFGLMNHPVNCLVFAAGVESCPNRFSERELKTMGFSAIPAPARSPCIDSKNALLAQLTTLKTQLATAKATLDASDASLASMGQQIKALEAKYPGGMPPDVYAQYKSLIDQYNATLSVERGQVSSYNALVTQSNGVIDQVNRLLC